MIKYTLVAIFVLLQLLQSIRTDENAAESLNNYRFEYKYSFKGPHLTQPDQTVPFWNVMGDVVPGDEQVRLVPSIRDKKGLIWSKYQFPHNAWQIEVQVRIEGRGKIGADGLAIWYVESEGELGPVFGSKNYFKGVGIILDSFDNDNRMNNPYIYVVVNDGTKSFDHGSDGLDQQSGGCLRDFRNRPFPVKLKIVYLNNRLEVFYSAGNLANEEYQICTSVENVYLPPNYYFGVSAATGGLADDHDVLKFLTWSIGAKEKKDEEAEMQEEEREKLKQDYDKNLEDFNKMQEEYKKQHPDAKTDQQLSPDQLYEGVASHELAAIFEIQNDIKQSIHSLSQNLLDVIEKQSTIHSLVSMINDGIATRGAPVQQGVPQAGADDNAKRYHIDNVLNMQRENYDIVKQLKDTLQIIQSSVNTIDYRIQEQAQKSAGGGDSYESVQQRQEIIQIINNMQSDVSALLHRQPSAPKLSCPVPEMPSCVPLAVFVIVAIIQVAVLLIYHSMRAAREDAAKKFF